MNLKSISLIALGLLVTACGQRVGTGGPDGGLPPDAGGSEHDAGSGGPNPDAGSSDAGGSTDGGGSKDGGTGTGAGVKFDYLVVILMENHGYSDIYGTATYMTSLADQYTNLQNYSAIDHPSLPNYLSLFGDLAGDCSNSGGANGGCMTGGGDSTSDCSPQVGGSCWMGSNVNLVDRLEAAGLTWQAWNEGAGGPCDYGAGNVRHVPFLYFNDIVSNNARCNRVVQATPGSDQELIQALGSTATASNFMWLTPDDNHNMHDNSIASGDAYLGTIVPEILASNVFKTQRAALFIVFDEDANGTYPSSLVYAVWSGPVVQTTQKPTPFHDHYSFAATLEANWHLASLNMNDANATPMMEVFK